MSIVVRQDDLSSPEVRALVAEHLSGMEASSPPGHVHALAIESLRAPGVTLQGDPMTEHDFSHAV